MRILVQRVSEAKVSVEGRTVGKIGRGLLVLIGVGQDDEEEDLNWLVQKLLKLRIFSDPDGKMNLSILDLENPQVLLISQFTLHAKTKKGNRPSFISAARPDMALAYYQQFGESLSHHVHVEYGIFGADMKVQLVNDGPVTIWMDSRQRE